MYLLIGDATEVNMYRSLVAEEVWIRSSHHAQFNIVKLGEILVNLNEKI